MPEITIYTDDGDCANGVAEINPFTVGDATDEWTLKFNNGTDFYAPSNVTMRVGHTNGLPDGTYSNAFKWVDRADNKSTGSIAVSGGVPALSFDSNPAGGVVGGNGVYVLRGPELDGAITNIQVAEAGSFDTSDGYSTAPVLEIDGSRPGSYDTSESTSLDPVYNSSPSSNSLSLATANLVAEAGDLQELIGNSAYFNGSSSVIIPTVTLTGNFTVSFKVVSFFPSDSSEKWLYGVVGTPLSGEIYQRSCYFNKSSSNSFSVSLSNPSELVTFSGINFSLLEDNEEYDLTLSRSGSNWSLSFARNGSTVTSSTTTGATSTIAITRFGGISSYSLKGIMRDIVINNGTTNIHSYLGAGADLTDWTDGIGTNDATAVYGISEFSGQGSGRSVPSVNLITGGSGFSSAPIVTLNRQGIEVPASGTALFPLFKAIGNWAKYEFPFKRDESGNNIVAATTLSPYSDGQVTDVTEYDHSTLVIRPETVATASLTQSGTDWVGTMNPINSYVTERLALRNSTQLDIQIRGDGRTLFQGQLTILNKIA